MSILDQIVEKTRETIARDKSQTPPDQLESRVKDAPPTRDFVAALAEGEEVRLIAEVKKASPSAGLIREDFDPPTLAAAYQAGGAACISVLTDEPFFKGSLQYLRDVRQAVDLPILRKDFIVDRYQLLQARECGADCVLLIAECLSPPQMLELHQQAVELGMATLIELFEPDNLEPVLLTGTHLVGINNRNLKTFETSLDHTLELCPRIPEDRLVVGESGIRTRDDVATLKAGGVKAILVGESLMRQPDVTDATRQLLGKAAG